MFFPIIYIILGFALLVWSADKFTKNSSKIANIFNISPFIIGVLILGFGTSAPEMLVSGIAAYQKHPELSIGNVFGSNILNISLVLAISAIILPIKISKDILKKQWLYLMFITILTGFLIYDLHLGTIDGLILLSLLIIFLIYSINNFKNNDKQQENKKEDIKKSNKPYIWLMLLISLSILLFSANMIVDNASILAKYFGVSDLIIGITILALGTSLPELAISINSALKKEYQMIIGNIIGSNIFNTLGVLAIAAIIRPFAITTTEIINRDYIFMFVITLLVFVLSYRFKQDAKIGRTGGLFLLAILIVYIYLLF